MIGHTWIGLFKLLVDHVEAKCLRLLFLLLLSTLFELRLTPSQNEPCVSDEFVCFRYEKRLAMFMHKLDEISKMNSNEIPDTASSTASEAPVSKFLIKLGECMQYRGKSPSPIEERDCPVEVASEVSFEPDCPSKYDRIAALRAKSVSLQVN